MKIVLFVFVFLTLSKAFKFDPEPRGQDVTNDRSATLSCGASDPGGTSGGFYIISWLYNGDPVVNNNRRYQQGDNLYIKRVNRTLDSGEFQCQATNNVTGDYEVTPPVEFNIKWVDGGVVTLKTPSSPDKILPGVKVVIKCGVEGNPKPTGIIWELNGVRINASTNIGIKNRRLSINNVTLNVYDGNYICCVQHPPRKTCSIALNLKVIDPRTPKLIKGPLHEDLFVRKSKSLSIPCHWEATPKPNVSWYRAQNSKPIANKTRSDGSCKRCVYPNGTLYIDSIKQSHEGTYTCFATSGLIKSAPVRVNIKIATISSFEVPHISLHARIGINMEYICPTPEALPTAEIKWLRHNRVIREDSDHISSSDGILLFTNTLKSDEGVYTCLAENIAGKVTMNMTFSIEVKPICSKLFDQTINERSTATWECPCRGIPTPEITWYKVERNSEKSQSKYIMKGKELVIKDVTSADKGIYFCEAKSEIGDARSNQTLLVVNESFKISPQLTNKCFEEGSKVKIFCKIEGSKNPQVSWNKINGILVEDSATLTFNPVTFDDAGHYKCEGRDGPKFTEKVIEVKVVEKTRIIVEPENTTVFDNVNNVLLNCKANNNKTQVLWRFKNHNYTFATRDQQQKTYVILNGSLVITNPKVTDRGLYVCVYRVCDQIQVQRSAELFVTEADDTSNYDITSEDNSNPNQMIQTIALSVSGGVAYILLTVALIIYCRGKHKKKRKDTNTQEETEVMINGTNGDVAGNHDNDIQMRDLSTLGKSLETLDYPSSNINSLTLIGRGKFGKVFLSKAPGLFPDLEEDILVMVKSFEQDLSDDLRSEFNREVNILRLSSHDNIVRLLALSNHGNDPEDNSNHGSEPTYLITEYLEWGILKLCLQASREGKVPKLTKNHKMSICSQLASGLAHLNKQGLVHGDIATRNCVVSSQLLVKISFLGLNLEGFENEYVDHEERELPLRWVPPEVLSQSEYSMKSDVFAFGVSCWEVFTLGELPFQDYSDEEFLKELENGEIPPLPALENSRRITSLINKCRAPLPGNRPDIRQITKKLQSIISTNTDSNKTKAIVNDDCEVIITGDED